MIATGSQSKAEVLRTLNALGFTTRTGRPVPIQTFQRMLRNPIYAGWVSIPAWELKERGKHEPLVSEELFNTVQDALDGTRAAVVSYQRNHPDFPLRVFARCEKCGSPLTGAWSTGRKKKFAYYRCRKSKCDGVKNVRRETVETDFIQLLQRLTPDPALIADFEDAVRTMWNRRQGDAEAAYSAAQKRIEVARFHNDRLITLRLDEEIDQETYRRRAEVLRREIADAERELRSTEAGFLDLEGVLAFARKIVTSPARLWMESSVNQRQRLQKAFFPDGLVYGKCGLEPRQYPRFSVS